MGLRRWASYWPRWAVVDIAVNVALPRRELLVVQDLGVQYGRSKTQIRVHHEFKNVSELQPQLGMSDDYK